VDGHPVSATNLIGLILAVVLSIFLIVALMFPERF
jgi:K+-transporting ATPase KdpF subunit